jgi:hypothetical protein
VKTKFKNCPECKSIRQAAVFMEMTAWPTPVREAIMAAERRTGHAFFTFETPKAFAKAVHAACHGWTHCGDRCCGRCEYCRR